MVLVDGTGGGEGSGTVRVGEMIGDDGFDSDSESEPEVGLYSEVLTCEGALPGSC